MIIAFQIFSSKFFRHKRLEAFVRKQLAYFARLRLPAPRVSTVTVLLYVVSFYLVLSRLGPVVSRVGEKAADTLELESFLEAEFDREGLQSFKEVYKRFREVTRVPGLFVRRSPNSHLVSLISIMGNFNSSKKQKEEEGKGKEEEAAAPQQTQPTEEEGKGTEEAGATPKPPPAEEEGKGTEEAGAVPKSPEKEEVTGPEQQQQDKPESHIETDAATPPEESEPESPADFSDTDPEDPSKESKKEKSASRNDTDGIFKKKSGKPKEVRFAVYEDNISTGDLALLYRDTSDIPHYAIFVQHDECDPNFPLLLIKGKTKPLPLERFARNVRNAHPVSAVTRIFYGDYSKVAVRHLKPQEPIHCSKAMELIDKVQAIPFSDKEVTAIQAARTPAERSSIVCTFMVAHFYSLLGVLNTDPTEVLPTTLQNELPLSDPVYIRLPAMKPGPVLTGDPPFLQKLIEGIRPPRDVTTKAYSEVVKTLDTGDIVLFSGATSSGAIIRFFDHSEFSHIGLVLKAKYTSQMLIYEASTNKAGLVDIESGKVRQGVELLPLRHKIFSGWYDRVAVRRLVDITPEQRKEIYEGMLALRHEFQGKPYEKSKWELLLSSLDIHEGFLSFLRNQHEDLSSLFCSELVAAAYQRLGLLGRDKLSNEYTPDDFTSARNLQLNFGRLEPEEYIDLKFDFNPGLLTQESVY